MVSALNSLRVARLLALFLLKFAGLSVFADDLEIQSISRSASEVRLEFNGPFDGEPGSKIWLESTNVISSDVSWETETKAAFVSQSGAPLVVTLPKQTASQRFYRIRYVIEPEGPITFDLTTIPTSVSELHDNPITVTLTEPESVDQVELWLSPTPEFDLDTGRRLAAEKVKRESLTFALDHPIIVPNGKFYLFARGLSGETDVVFTESPPASLTGAEDDLTIEDLKIVGVKPNTNPKIGGRLVTVQFKVLEKIVVTGVKTKRFDRFENQGPSLNRPHIPYSFSTRSTKTLPLLKRSLTVDNRI